MGDNTTAAGITRTSPTGFLTITAQGIKDSASGKSFEIPAPSHQCPWLDLKKSSD